MEFRFFYSINENIFNTKWRTRHDLENRTDIYFILSSNHLDEFHFEYGLKLRNKKNLELKIRERRFSNGQEYWIKIIHSHKTTSIDDLDSIIKILKKSNQKQLIERLLLSQPIIICHLEKIRQQKSIGHGLIQEITGLHLKFIQLNDHLQIGNDLFFETICIEQSNSHLIDENIIQNIVQQYGNNHIYPMGYPEFLFRQYQQIIN